MPQVRNFKSAFAVSLILHLLALFPFAALNVLPPQKAITNIEVNYFKISSRNTVLVKKPLEKSPESDLEKIGLGQKIILSDKDKIPERAVGDRQKLDLEDLLIKAKNSFQKPEFPKAELLPRGDIKLSIEESAKSQNPAYLSYRNFLHESLRRYLYSRYSSSAERGEVFLTFMLNSNGTVKEAQIIDARSNASANLKRIVLESLYEAAPFPPLPESLNSPILSFSVTIHFKEQEIE